MREIRQGQFYRHFKGGLYQVMAIATHSETKEKMVVYQALYGDYGIYVRPYDMFASEVDHEKYPQVKQVYRFTQVHPEEENARVEVESALELTNVDSEQLEIPDLKEVENVQSMKSPVQILDPVEMSAKEPPAKEPSEQEPPEQEPQADGINPILLEFLDADTLEEKMHIMTFYRNQMDEALLNSIAISLDLVVDKKGLQETYDEIMNCLSMMKHFECTNRFR
jgi:hypothetical protein